MTRLAAIQLEQALKSGNIDAADWPETARALAGIFASLDYSMSNGKLDDIQGRGDGAFGRTARGVEKIYGASTARLMPHGSSLTNLALAQALRLTLGRPPRVLAERTLHLSSLGGLILSEADVNWIDREYLPHLGVQMPVTPQQLNEALEKGEYDAAWLTVPTYTGFLADCAAIAEVCRRHNVKFLADSAWGALQGLLPDYPPSPAGVADAAAVSLHKSGIGLSGASVALFNDEELLRGYDEATVLGLVSTSPPYYAGLAMEKTLEWWYSEQGRLTGNRLPKAAKAFATAVESIPGFSYIDPESLGAGIEQNPSHVLFRTVQTGLTGYQIQSALADREIDAEMATLDSLLFLFGPNHVATWPRLVTALQEIVARAEKRFVKRELPSPPQRPPKVMDLHKAFYAPHRQLPATDAIGKVSAQFIAAYPPGSALLVPGEEITADVIDYLLRLESEGSRLKGVIGKLAENGLRTVANSNNQKG